MQIASEEIICRSQQIKYASVCWKPPKRAVTSFSCCEDELEAFFGDSLGKLWSLERVGPYLESLPIILECRCWSLSLWSWCSTRKSATRPVERRFRLDRVPAWLQKVRRVNEPLKNRDFDFGGHFLSQNKVQAAKMGYIWNPLCADNQFRPSLKKFPHKIFH